MSNPTTPKQKPFDKMTTAELREATNKYDEPFGGVKGAKPLTAAQKAQHARARRRSGRPRTGQGAKVISLSVERSLLKRADDYAKAQKLSRAEVVAMGLKNVLAGAE